MNNSSKPAGNLFNAIAKNAQSTTTQAANTLANAATTTMNAMKNVAKNIPVVNSLLPLSNTGVSAAKNTNIAAPLNNAAKAINKAANTAANAAVNAANAAVNAANNTFKNIIPSAANTSAGIASGFTMPWWGWPLVVFIVIAGIATTLFVVYSKEISDGIQSMFGKKEPAPAPAPAPAPTEPGTEAPATAESPGSGLLNKLLPVGSPAKEVFNVSSNEFTYYDAEPMCRALGAELATYDQVMDAWKKGADWCNYGWVKGQSAVYPTQDETFARLQTGPEDDQKACGKPGINGGFFDNPELRFGVNCYGVKPSQTANDQKMLEERGVLPRTTATLLMDQQAQEYKDRLASIGVLPFNMKEWSSA